MESKEEETYGQLMKRACHIKALQEQILNLKKILFLYTQIKKYEINDTPRNF